MALYSIGEVRLVVEVEGVPCHLSRQSPGWSAPGQDISMFLASEQFLESLCGPQPIHHFQFAGLHLTAYLLDPERKRCTEFLVVLCAEPLSTVAWRSLQSCPDTLGAYLQQWQCSRRYQTAALTLEHLLRQLGHQLREPLALTRLSTDLLEAEPETQWNQLSRIRAGLELCERKLNSVLTCARTGAMCFETLDLRDLLHEIVDSFQPLFFSKNVTICCDTDSLPLQADRQQLREVFENLLSNALHFSPPGGRITLRGRLLGEELAVEVSDQGPGLAPEELQEIFRPYFTHRAEGLGLGLTIARKIVLDHQGSIWADNLPAGGARFTVVLPQKRVATHSGSAPATHSSSDMH